MAILNLIHLASARLLIIWEAMSQRVQARPQLGYREQLDVGIYRGHIDRVASAMRESI